MPDFTLDQARAGPTTADTSRVFNQLTSFFDWLRRRAVSRAGASALAMSARPYGGAPRTPLGRRWVGQIVGSGLVALGVGVTLATDIGVGPLDVFNIGLAERLDVPMAIAVWLVAAVMMVLAAVLGNPPRLGTLVTPFVLGAVLEPIADAFAGLASLPFIAAMGVQVVGVTVIGIGAGAIVVAGFGAGLGELISEASSWRFGRSMSTMRLCLEVTLLGVGVALGGPFGPGTVLVAILIGPAVTRGVRWSEPLVNGPLQRAVSTDTPPGFPSTSHRRHEVPEASPGLVHR